MLSNGEDWLLTRPPYDDWAAGAVSSAYITLLIWMWGEGPWYALLIGTLFPAGIAGCAVGLCIGVPMAQITRCRFGCVLATFAGVASFVSGIAALRQCDDPKDLQFALGWYGISFGLFVVGISIPRFRSIPWHVRFFEFV
jgi:hypothetical protein